MKKFINIAIAALALVSVSACHKVTTEGVTGTTYYANITLEGGSTINWPIGTKWEEPGFSAVLKGEDVTSQVIVGEAPDVTVPGAYTVTYTHINPDGYPYGVERTVFVCDPTVTINFGGTYTIDPEASMSGTSTFTQVADKRKASYPDTYGLYVSTDYQITFTKIAPGFYYCDDLLGGWYKYIQGRGGYYKASYGSAYFTYFDMQGYVLIDNAGNISYISGKIAAWGDGLDSLTGKFDEATGKLSYSWVYAGSVKASPVLYKD